MGSEVTKEQALRKLQQMRESEEDAEQMEALDFAIGALTFWQPPPRSKTAGWVQ